MRGPGPRAGTGGTAGEPHGERSPAPCPGWVPREAVGPCGGGGRGVSAVITLVRPEVLLRPVAVFGPASEVLEQEMGIWALSFCSRSPSPRSWSGPARVLAVATPAGPHVAGTASQAGAPGLAGNGLLPLLPGGSSGASSADPARQRTAGRSAQVSFLRRAKVIRAPRCHLSDPTCSPSSLTSPAGPRCTSVSVSCWARTGSRGLRAPPPALP